MSCAGCNGPTRMTEQDPMLEPFEALIGTWATEATHPLVDVVVPGSISFEWLEGGRFLIQRSRNEHELFPDAICLTPKQARVPCNWRAATRAGRLAKRSPDSRYLAATPTYTSGK